MKKQHDTVALHYYVGRFEPEVTLGRIVEKTYIGN
jgi:hypothetical protein